MVQGQRLKEVVQQLQAALRPFPDQEHEQGSSAAAIGARTPLNLPRLPQQPAMRVEAAEWKDRSGVRPARWMPGATPRRCSGDSPSQPPISVRVRPQPMQKPVSGSTTQILMQGVSMAG